jgi:DNA invertase Pin-like site-specific DNA recombinase
MAGLMKGSTTSMGRLTLNVLLSFAQFEREVTGERIRDKIAASKRKGKESGAKFGPLLSPEPDLASPLRHTQLKALLKTLIGK